MTDLIEAQRDLTDMETRTSYLKFELHNAIEDGDIVRVQSLYHQLTEGEILQNELQFNILTEAIHN